MASNVRPLDPVQGFVDYVLNVKPYHSKIVEVLIEYIYTDELNVTILDELDWNIEIARPAPLVDFAGCLNGYDTTPYDMAVGYLVQSVNEVDDTFTLRGDIADQFPVGTEFRILSQILDTSNNTVVDPAGLHSGSYTVTSSTFDSGDAITGPLTTLTVAQDITAPAPVLVPPQVYVVELFQQPINIVDVIGYSNIGNRPTEEPDESAFFDIGSNMFVIDGNRLSRFSQGQQLRVVHSLMNNGTYTVLYSDIVGGQTRIRVVENIVDTTVADGQIAPVIVSYDYVPPVCSDVPDSLVQVFFDEQVEFSGMTIELHDNIIAYNFENSDSNPYDMFMYDSTEPAIGEIELVGSESFWAADNEVNYTLSSLVIPLSDPVLLRVTINGWPAGVTITSPTTFTITSPLPIVETDLIVAKVYDRTATEVNAIVYPYDAIAHSYYVSPLDTALDLVNGAFIISGGNFVQRFTPERNIVGYDTVLPVGIVGTWNPRSYNITSVDNGLSEIRIAGAAAWLFLAGRVFTIQASVNNSADFVVSIDSTYDAITNETVIITTAPPAETFFTNPDLTPIDQDYSGDLGVIIGAVYDPTVIGSGDQPKTIVAVSTPVLANVDSLSYDWFGPLRFTVGMQSFTGIGSTFVDGLGLSDYLLEVPDSYDIFLTVAAADTFSIRYIDNLTSLAQDLTGSFSPGTVFRVVGSAGNVNNQEWTVASSIFDGTDTIITTVEDITDEMIPYGRIQREALLIGTGPDTDTDATIIDNLAFGWGQVIEFAIIATDEPNDIITLGGDQTGIFDVGDDFQILGSDGNDGNYEIVSFVYNVGPNETDVVTNPPIPNQPGPGLDGIMRMDDIDITAWFQYNIIEANSGTNIFTIFGDATSDIMLGMQFRVLGTPSNNGIYEAAFAPVFNPTTGTTDVAVVETILVTEEGGFVESFRDYGIRILLTDVIGVSTMETADAAVMITGDSMVGSFDSPYYDIGSFDETLGSLIRLYGGTFPAP